MLLSHSRIVGLSSRGAIVHSVVEQLLDGILIQQLFDGVFIQVPTYTAKGVGDFIVCPTYVFDLEVVSSHCRYPPVSDGIQVRRRHDIGQRVIVGPDEEGLVLRILPKLLSYGPFEGQELQFRGVVLQLASLEAVTSLGYGVITTIALFLGQHCP